MSLRVIGAGWPRTGTTSLKVALEMLLSSRCYHMYDLFADPEQIGIWERALEDDMSGVHRVMSGYGAALDWPASFFWRQLHVPRTEQPTCQCPRSLAAEGIGLAAYTG